MNKILKFIPFILLVFIILGILCSQYLFQLNPESLLIINVVFIIIFCFGFYLSKNHQKYNFIFSFIFFVGALLVGYNADTFSQPENQHNHYANQSYFEEDKLLQVVFRVSDVLKPTEYTNRYYVSILQINKNAVTGKSLLVFNKKADTILLKEGEVYSHLVAFKKIESPQNPFAFDYKKYLQRQQIVHQLYEPNILSNKENLQILSNQDYTSKLKYTILNNLTSFFAKNEVALLNAILLGDRNLLSTELMDSFTNAGAIHILAVSGLHIGMLVLILLFICKPIDYVKHGKFIKVFIIILILWLYAYFVGFSSSVVRAVTMFSILTLSVVINRKSSVYNTLIISMILLLLIRPLYLFDVGFQLSYLAVFFIVWLQPKIQQLLTVENKILHYIWQLFTVSLAAQIGVLPLSLYYFHQFPSLFFVSNLFLIPVLGIFILFGIVIIILSFLQIPEVFSNLFSGLVKYVSFVVQWIGEKESFVIDNISISLVQVAILYVIIAFTFHLIKSRSFKLTLYLLISIIVFQGTVIFKKYTIESSSEFIVFNKIVSSNLLIRNGEKVTLYSKQAKGEQDYSIKNYMIANKVTSHNLIHIDSVTSFYKFKNEVIALIHDNQSIAILEKIKPTILILQNSPKININRYLQELKPKIVVADASNYTSFIKMWQQTCEQQKTPFHFTKQKGAYILK